MDFQQYTNFTIGWMLLAVMIFFLLLFITAPYGRHTKTTWGPLIDNRLGWIIMEIFVVAVFFFLCLQAKTNNPLPIILSFLSLLFIISTAALFFHFDCELPVKKCLF